MHLSQYLNTAIYGLCLIAPWSLLWLDSRLLFPYTTGKAWVFRVLVELTFALCLLARFTATQSRPVRPQKDNWTRAFIYLLFGFLAWTAITDLIGIDPYRSLWSNWERMGGLLEYVHWGMYLFCLHYAFSKDRQPHLLYNLVAVIVMVSVLGILDDQNRSRSTLGNPIYLGNLAALGIFVSAFLLSSFRPASKPALLLVVRLSLAVGMLVMLWALFASATRGAMAALLAGGMTVALIVFSNLAWRHSKHAFIAFLGALLVSGGLLVSQYPKLQESMQQSDVQLLQRIGRISLQNQTTADRLENWRIALDAAHKHPVAGWGQENYMIAFNEFYRAGVMDSADLWFDRTHNAYLEVLIASGVPGLLLYTLILLMPLVLTWQNRSLSRLEKAMLSGFFVAYMVKNMVGFDTFSSSLAWISVVAFTLLSNAREAAPVEQANPYKEMPAWLLPTVVLLLAILAIYTLNIRPYQDNLRFARLMGDPLALRSAQLTAVLELPVNRLMYAQNAKLAVLDNLIIKSRQRKLTSLERKRLDLATEQARSLITEALRLQPRNYRIKYNGALLYARTGHHVEAIALLEDLTRLLPNRTAFWHTLSRLYMRTGQSDLAASAIQTAQTLNPDWKP